MRRRKKLTVELAMAATLLCAAVMPLSASGQTSSTVSGLNAAQMLALASRFEHDNKAAAAEQIYSALEMDPDRQVRNEARFRHAQLLEMRGNFSAAITLYRAILAEQPDAQRVRIELAAVLAKIDDNAGARRELRLAQAGGLPPEVARVVDQYSAALRSTAPFGASMEFALAPSTNINRATSASTLDTIIAPFQLSDDARAQSGVGVELGGQFFARAALSRETALTFRVAAQADLYHQASFDDDVASAQIGVETWLGSTQIRTFIGRSYRWFGNEPYADTNTLSLDIEHSLNERSKISAEVAVGQADYRLNDLQSGPIYTASALYEIALSQTNGVGFGPTYERQDANDAGYATTATGVQLLLWDELPNTSLFAELRGSELEADARLSLFPKRREDTQGTVTVGATLPQFRVFGFEPTVQLSYERNNSTVGIYDYSRFAGALGFQKAF
jgi:hypothetical protein